MGWLFIFLGFLAVSAFFFIHEKHSERIMASVPQFSFRSTEPVQSRAGVSSDESVAEKMKSASLKIEDPVPMAEETHEQKMDRLAREVASEEFIKRVMEIEKKTVLPELKDENLIEDEVFENAYYKKYKIKNRQIAVGGSENRYIEEIRNKDGEELFMRSFSEGQLHFLQIKMDKPGGLHSFTFDPSGAVVAIYSEVAGEQFSQRFQNGKLIERLRVSGEGAESELISF